MPAPQQAPKASLDVLVTNRTASRRRGAKMLPNRSFCPCHHLAELRQNDIPRFGLTFWCFRTNATQWFVQRLIPAMLKA